MVPENTVAEFATLAYIKDLEELLEMKIREVKELTDEQEQFNDTKDEEILYLIGEKFKFNKTVAAKKDLLEKHIDEAEARILMLEETMHQSSDVESRLTRAERGCRREKHRPQGLKTGV